MRERLKLQPPDFLVEFGGDSNVSTSSIRHALTKDPRTKEPDDPTGVSDVTKKLGIPD